MIRAWFTLGVVVLLVAKAWGQGGKPDDAAGAASKAPVAVPAPPSAGAITGLVYKIEMKLVEGKGASGNDFERPTRQSDSQPETPRRPLRDVVGRSIAPPATRSEKDSIGSNAGGNLPAHDLQPTRSRGEPEDIWATFSQDPHLKTIMVPRILVPAKQTACVELRNPQSFSYLEPMGNDNYHLRRTDKEQLGMRFTAKVQPVEGEADCVDTALEIETTTLDGREPVKGLDLDAGKPIIASRSLKTTVRMILGVTRIIPIPSGPETEAALLVRINRYEPEKKD
jgi:hypothetical protein